MRELPSECIDLTVTSPPYDNLRTYKGYSFDFNAVSNELFRITRRGGVLVWIVNDATIKGSETGTSFKQALHFKDLGFNLHDTMIWIKDGGGAIGSHKCYTQNFEYMFVLSKGIPKTINLIYDKENKSFGTTHGKVGRRKPNGEQKLEERKSARKFSKRNNWWYCIPGKNCSTKDNEAFKHPAIFPEQIVNDHIISWSNEGDIVFDPFVGSGTTAKMALLNNRHYIGFDISEEYCEIARARVEKYKQRE